MLVFSGRFAGKFEDEVSTGSGSDRVTSRQTRFLLSFLTRSLPLPVLTSSPQRQLRHSQTFGDTGNTF